MENATVYAVANLCQSILTIEFLEKRSEFRLIGVEPASVTVCNYNVQCQHLGVAPEAGAYSPDKMTDPAYKRPYAFD